MITTTGHRIFSTTVASVYPLYLAKVEKKGRTRDGRAREGPGTGEGAPYLTAGREGGEMKYMIMTFGDQPGLEGKPPEWVRDMIEDAPPDGILAQMG